MIRVLGMFSSTVSSMHKALSSISNTQCKEKRWLDHKGSTIGWGWCFYKRVSSALSCPYFAPLPFDDCRRVLARCRFLDIRLLSLQNCKSINFCHYKLLKLWYCYSSTKQTKTIVNMTVNGDIKFYRCQHEKARELDEEREKT